MDYIFKIVDALLRKYKTNDVYELAERAGLKLWFRPLGNLKGLYTVERKSRYIVVNDELDDITMKVVCAHELGHDMLHRGLAGGGIRETTMYLDNNRTEREANLFAANILISDSRILSEMQYTNDINELSYELSLPAEIVNYKLESLNAKGYSFNFSQVRNDFLK